jgi:hypothetical protein
MFPIAVRRARLPARLFCAAYVCGATAWSSSTLDGRMNATAVELYGTGPDPLHGSAIEAGRGGIVLFAGRRDGVEFRGQLDPPKGIRQAGQARERRDLRRLDFRRRWSRSR